MRSTEIFKLGSVGKIFIIIFPNDVTISKFDLEGSSLATKRVSFEGDDARDEKLVVITKSSLDSSVMSTKERLNVIGMKLFVNMGH